MAQVNASEHNALLFYTPVVRTEMCGAFVGWRHKKTFSQFKSADSSQQITVCDQLTDGKALNTKVTLCEKKCSRPEWRQRPLKRIYDADFFENMSNICQHFSR